jgi:hypothetical protein
MILKRLTLVILSCGIFGAVAYATSNTGSEAAVRKHVEQHLTAIKKADRLTLEKSWAKDVARITTVDSKNQIVSQPIAKAFDLWTDKPTPNMSYTIQSIDVVDDKMATVKATIQWRSGVYDDVLTLMKVNGQWKLTGKHYVEKASEERLVLPNVRKGGYGAF